MRQRSLVPGIVSVNVTAAAIITPQRIPLRKESFISIPFDQSLIEARARSGPLLLRFIANRVIETQPSPRDSLKTLHRYIGLTINGSTI